jgi:hypothetical protein
MEKRKRITTSNKGDLNAIIDPDAYSPNKSTKNAKKIIHLTQQYQIEIWFDKHYSDKVAFGDENGARFGIEESSVISLVENSFKHLLYYSSIISTFNFINCKGSQILRNSRIVLQKKQDDTILNCVIEVHNNTVNIFELTVITAMCNDDFRISDGQFFIYLDHYNSILYKRVKNKNEIICEI